MIDAVGQSDLPTSEGIGGGAGGSEQNVMEQIE